MPLFDAPDLTFVETVSELISCNPFLPEWIELERQALGADFCDAPRTLSRQGEQDLDDVHPNTIALGKRIDRLAEQAQQRLSGGLEPTQREKILYEDLVTYHLYLTHADAFFELIDVSLRQPDKPVGAGFWKGFEKSFDTFFVRIPCELPSRYTAEHLFSWFFQVRRAFYHIYRFILGTSRPAGLLRGAVWQSVFTHDLKRWTRTLYRHMGGFPTLITGPSGTGKELVARAIGLSRYIHFNPAKGSFEPNFAGTFYPLNVCALAPTLIESELFGHKEGSFTGAFRDHKGWLEVGGTYGTVFLDEVGELDPAIQPKLLRVLESRDFQRLGDTEVQKFGGKIIAATNRDLAEEVRAGCFREDLYFRLNGDRITTPSLSEQLADAPDDLPKLVESITWRIIRGEGTDERVLTADEQKRADELAGELADEVVPWIERHLGRDYPWPGNYRELKQCVRSFVIRGSYQPALVGGRAGGGDPCRALGQAVAAGTLTAAALERRYFTLVYFQVGNNYQEAARRLECDWRTLKEKIDADFLRELAAGAMP